MLVGCSLAKTVHLSAHSSLAAKAPLDLPAYASELHDRLDPVSRRHTSPSGLHHQDVCIKFLVQMGIRDSLRPNQRAANTLRARIGRAKTFRVNPPPLPGYGSQLWRRCGALSVSAHRPLRRTARLHTADRAVVRPFLEGVFPIVAQPPVDRRDEGANPKFSRANWWAYSRGKLNLVQARVIGV